MADRGGTMLDMAKGNRKSGKSPQGRSPSHVVYARIPVDLGAAFERYVNQVRPKTDKAAVIEIALEQYLRSVGFWPPDEPATT